MSASDTKTHSYPHTPFSVAYTPIDNGKGYWNSYRIEVFRDDVKIGEYTRNYPSFAVRTFHPFQHKGTWYALYSKDYTATRVARLTDTFEDWCGEEPDSIGFCPVEFFVPRGSQEEYTFKDEKRDYISWFDAEYDDEDEFVSEAGEKPILWATYGFLSGCIWGDDSSWKLRYIDFSELENKVLKIEERFGYWELASDLTIRQSIRIYGHGTFGLVGQFHMNLNKTTPNEAFRTDFFSSEG